jgi:lysozyme
MDGLELSIKNDEGLKLFPYIDTEKKWTIGWGRNLTDRGIRLSEAQLMLQNDIDEARMELSHYDWFNAMDRVRQDVLVELNFNIGLKSLLTFTTFLGYIKAKDYSKAANDLLGTLWAKQVHEERANGMAQRLRAGMYASN